jgi:putative transposase
MPASLEQLDLLLLTAAKTRRVQQDGIHFQSHRSMDINLAALVKEEVLIRYDPADMGEIHVFYQDRFLCRAICAELSGEKVSLQDIERVRSERRKQVRAGLSTRAAMVNRYVEMHHEPPPAPKTLVAEPAPVEARPRLKRYINDE